MSEKNIQLINHQIIKGMVIDNKKWHELAHRNKKFI